MNTTFENCTLLDTVTWFQKARPLITLKDFNSQLGVHFEEVSEMMEQLGCKNSSTAHFVSQAYVAVKALANHLKSNSEVDMITIPNPVEFLDAICDQIVTGTGVAHCKNYNLVGAMTEVNRSNFSKFGEDGNPLYDENGKVIKGPNYSKAELSPYVPQ